MHFFKNLKLSFFIILFCCSGIKVLGQSISGFVHDENHNPVGFANVFIRELNSGTSTDEKGYYFLTLNPGIYNIIISSVGYKTVNTQLIIGDKPLVKDYLLETSNVQLEEIVVKGSKKDPAYEIIKFAIDNKSKFLLQSKSYKTSVYIKATEVVDDKKQKKLMAQQEEEDISVSGPPVNPLDEQKKKEQSLLNNINMVEMKLVLNFQYPDKYKEERIAYKAYGQKEGLYIPLFSETDFNFYENLVQMKGISDVPLISPISRTAMLSYKYKLEEILKENDQVVYKIKVTPRKTGDATGEGYIFINEGIWNINRLELALHKGALKFYDQFSIKQDYQEIHDTAWFPVRQEFSYKTKAGSKTFEGNTVLKYAEYQKDYVFAEKFFGNEVSVTTKEAYKRDSVYWKESRLEPLTKEQLKLVNYRDSIEAAHSSKNYLDSIEASYNKLTFGEVLYHGVGFRSETKKSNLYLSPLLGLVGFEVIGGFRLGPSGHYFRRFENGRMLSAFASASMGFKNKDIQGNVSFWTRYNPLKLGDASFRIGRAFASINSFDAYLNQLKISNFILHDHIDLFHKRELFNGFYLGTDIGFHDRKSIDNYDKKSILNEVIDEDDPLVFEDYQALITTLRISYTPQQRYITEPNQKIVIGSKYPTFSISHKKGWDGIFTSDIDFDYLDVSLEHNLLLGTLGNSKYTLLAGKFVNTRDLRFVDLKRFRQSDPYLYSNPLHSFQLLDTSLVATNLFVEGHFIHHFNGAMINNLPFIKKTKIRTVAGGGFMWIQENNFRHQEVFGGIERVFKIGARRRLRIGTYGVLSQTNWGKPQTDFKISFDIIDTWKRDWSY